MDITIVCPRCSGDAKVTETRVGNEHVAMMMCQCGLVLLAEAHTRAECIEDLLEQRKMVNSSPTVDLTLVDDLFFELAHETGVEPVYYRA